MSVAPLEIKYYAVTFILWAEPAKQYFLRKNIFWRCLNLVSFYTQYFKAHSATERVIHVPERESSSRSIICRPSAHMP